MIEVKGSNGERLVYDGATVAKFRHNGMDEAARNPISTYREISIKHRPGKRGKPDTYEVMLAMTSFMMITIEASEKPQLDELVAALEGAKA